MIYIPFETQKTQISPKTENFSLLLAPPHNSQKIRNFPNPVFVPPAHERKQKSPHISCEPHIKYLSFLGYTKLSDYQSFLTVQFTNNLINPMCNFNKVLHGISFRCHCCRSNSDAARFFRASVFVWNTILI